MVGLDRAPSSSVVVIVICSYQEITDMDDKGLLAEMLMVGD